MGISPVPRLAAVARSADRFAGLALLFWVHRELGHNFSGSCICVRNIS